MDTSELRTRLVAILAADAAGYSRLMSLDEHATVATLEAARTIFRAQIAAHQGRIVDTAGDSVLAVFGTAVGAVAAALAVQADLAAAATGLADDRCMRFRIGVHLGDVIEKADGTVYGDGVNIAARLQSLAEPGGITASEAVRTIVGGRTNVDFVDQGVPLRNDLPGITRVFAARPVGAAGAAPRRPAQSPARLLHQPATLFGRDADVGLLSQWIVRDHLVTVVGTGGVGKTQVAAEIFRTVAGAFEDGAAWVDLAPLESVQHLLMAIANAAAVRLDDDGSDATEALARSLAGRKMLLLLDNSEHLAADVAAVVEAVLRAAPSVHVLVTSQQVLKLVAERVYRLDPLPVPPIGTPLARVAEFAAVAMLLDRASAANHRFELTAQSGDDIVVLSNHLDGLPLAIAMAAAWLPKLGAKALLTRLSEWRQLLRAPSHGMPPRQQTLRATLEWSHSLLEPAQQELLRRLSVFAGTFRVDLVHPVAGDDSPGESATLGVLSSLIDKSLVQTAQLDPPRFRLLETMRTYAAEQLDASGEAARTYQRHGRALAALAREAETRFWEMGDRDWLDLVAAEYDDFQAAFDRACDAREVDTAASIGMALQRMDHLRTVTAARRRRAVALFAMLQDASAQAKAWIWTCLTSHNMIALDIVSRMEASTQALAAWRRIGDSMRLHFALGFHANECARALDFVAADQALAEAASLEAANWPVRRKMWGASARAGVCIHRGDAAGYRENCRVELALADTAGAERAAAAVRMKLADAALMAGDLQEAIALGGEAVGWLRALDQPANLGLALSNLCSALVLAGQRAEAMAAARDALPLLSRNGLGIHLVFDALALIAAERCLYEDAARLLGYASNWYRTHADNRQPNEEHLARLAQSAAASAIGGKLFDAASQQGAMLSGADAELVAARVADGEGQAIAR